MTECYLRDDFAGAELHRCDGRELLHWGRRTAAAAPPAAVYREREGRRTLRLRRGGAEYFLKWHGGVGWGAIFRSLLRGRLPVVGAASEYRALCALPGAGVQTPAVAAYASAGGNPARRESLIVTDALTGTVSLEDYCASWARQPPDPALRRRLVSALAELARRLHAAGWQHRDFYLCHVHLRLDSLAGQVPHLVLIDLHRARWRRRLPRRWRVKDLAALHFSAMDCGLRRRDLLRFLRQYSDGGLRGALGRDAATWRRVASKASALYSKESSRRARRAR